MIYLDHYPTTPLLPRPRRGFFILLRITIAPLIYNRVLQHTDNTSFTPYLSAIRASGRFLTPPPERRSHPAALRRLASLPDKSGVPLGMAARLGGGVGRRPGAR